MAEVFVFTFRPKKICNAYPTEDNIVRPCIKNSMDRLKSKLKSYEHWKIELILQFPRLNFMPLIHSNTTAKKSVDYSLILIVMWSTIHKLRKTELSKKTKMIHKKKRNPVEQNFVWYFKNVKNYIKWHGMGFLWRPV